MLRDIYPSVAQPTAQEKLYRLPDPASCVEGRKNRWRTRKKQSAGERSDPTPGAKSYPIQDWPVREFFRILQPVPSRPKIKGGLARKENSAGYQKARWENRPWNLSVVRSVQLERGRRTKGDVCTLVLTLFSYDGNIAFTLGRPITALAAGTGQELGARNC